MSGAGSALRTACVRALRDDAVLKAALNGVFEGPAVRASPPYAEIAETVATDWGTKDRRGREVRLAVLAMPRDIGGWRVASLVFVRSRIAGEGPGRWIASVEFRVRVLAAS